LCVAFSPDGTRIVSGGEDGSVRLWTLEGKPAAEPFKGHEGQVNSVAFSPDGTRIVSGGLDGSVRLLNIATGTRSLLLSCRAYSGIGFIDNRFFWISCSDRISVLSASFEARGELFLNEEGLVATVFSEGVYVPTDRMQDSFRAVASDGRVNWQRHAVPELSIERARQVLLDDWTLRERISEFMRRAYEEAETKYAALELWWKGSFWIAVLWLTAILVAIVTFIFVPHKLAHWAMPSVGSPKMPTWKWLACVITLFGYLGTTRRPLKAWLRKHRDVLYDQNFAGRMPVKEREKYCNLIHEADIAGFVRDLSSRTGVRTWITGVGGSGKSALAYRMLRIATENKPSAPLRCLVDEDWEGKLLDHVAQLLKVDERVPTPKMVEILGAGGYLCLLIDSLSERGMATAVDQVAEAIDKGIFKSVVVTSRQPTPTGKGWEPFKTINARPLTTDQVPDYIATYAPEDRRKWVAQQIAPLISDGRSVSPLFLRFAIEQALLGEVTSTTRLDLVLQYVEALRAGKLDLSADDMLRAASIAATEAVREALVPREIEHAYLRGVLVKEADGMAFINAKSDKEVDPAAVIEMLVVSGLFNRNRTNRRLRFAYDPVAEQLAAWKVVQGTAEGVAAIKDRILLAPDSAIARAMAEIEIPAEAG
jgi:WD domain, G-beta repeat